MSNKARHRRTPDLRRARSAATGTGLAIAVGGAMAAAFVPMGTPSADDLVAPTATEDAFEQLVLEIDPNAFTSTGAPNDFLGTLASQINSDLANTVFGPELNTLATDTMCALNPTCNPTLVITPTTDDDPFTDLAQFIQQFIPSIAPAVLVPTLAQDLVTIGGDLDSFFANTAFGPELDTVVDQFITAFTTTAF